MKRPEFIARQASRPRGLVGRVIAWIMERETAPTNDVVIELLALAPRDQVLEVGFGHGRTIERMLPHVREGRIAGIDVSESMTKLAKRRARSATATVDLRTGDAAALPFGAGEFDKALSVHTLYFWQDPALCLRELRRVLRPGGMLVLGFNPSTDPQTALFPTNVYRFHSEEEVRSMLEAAGFSSVEMVPDGRTRLARATAV